MTDVLGSCRSERSWREWLLRATAAPTIAQVLFRRWTTRSSPALAPFRARWGVTSGLPLASTVRGMTCLLEASDASMYAEIGELVADVYIGEGYTPRERAANLTDITSWAAHATVLVARSDATAAIVGVVGFASGGGGFTISRKPERQRSSAWRWLLMPAAQAPGALSLRNASSEAEPRLRFGWCSGPGRQWRQPVASTRGWAFTVNRSAIRWT